MATKKVTLSLDTAALALAEQAAARCGLSLSAWLSKAARREAVRTGAGPPRADPVVESTTDEAEWRAAEEDMRAAG